MRLPTFAEDGARGVVAKLWAFRGELLASYLAEPTPDKRKLLEGSSGVLCVMASVPPNFEDWPDEERDRAADAIQDLVRRYA